MKDKYDTPADYIFSLQRMGIKLGLDKIRDFLEYFDDPHKDFDSVLIGGTNGKGSVSTITSNILQEAGYKTGLYTSPHLTFFEERIKVNGENICQDSLWELIDEVRPILEKIEEEDVEKRPSFFEVLTTLAFMHFSNQDIDIAVLEVGMGGRLDATNVVDNIASVVTNIGMDHSKHLGDTKEKIAYEKAGIIKESNYFVTEENDENITQYFRDVCAERNSIFNHALEREHEILETPLRLKLPEYGIIEVPGVARWQAENALTAITLAEGLADRGYDISRQEIIDALKKTSLPGRMDIVSTEPRIMMDCAHNLNGIKALMEGLKTVDYDRLLLVMGVLGDKDYKSMADVIDPKTDRLYTGEPVSERKLDSDVLADAFSDKIPKSTHGKGIDALNAAIEDYKEGDLILVTGSTYLLGDIRKEGKYGL
ncbi:MAG: bifunctional folylpolyglutamate synthase/dihydrofolate synthase [Thermoplasmata archaeon]